MIKPSPIKRDKSLVSLSKDHHGGLLLIWKIRQGLRLNVATARMATYITTVFDKELEPHFVDEEQLLFNKLPVNDALRITAEGHHAALRHMMATFRSTIAGEASVANFAALLEEHIRFEERTLFPHIEKMFVRQDLDQIGEQLEKHHAGKVCVVWDDEFWIKK
ncbi:MAG: hemerythrin domain-containing protein [Chitinophagaceae bacterium]|nr:hemerythrin domain-containing protein [Chitinophagaceae bacterium]